MRATPVKLAAAGTLLVALAGGTVGCGGTGVDEVEDQVASELKAQLQAQSRRQDIEEGASAPVDHIDCPDDVDTGEGAMFRCRALDADDKLVGTVTVQMRTEDDARWQFVAAAPS